PRRHRRARRGARSRRHRATRRRGACARHLVVRDRSRHAPPLRKRGRGVLPKPLGPCAKGIAGMNSSAAALWRLPVQWPAPQLDGALPATRCMQAAILFAILALTVLDRFGVRIASGYSIPPGMIALYALLGAMVVSRSGMLNTQGALAYLAVVCAAGLSYLANAMLRPPPAPSIASFLLLAVLYLPFAFSLRPDAVRADLWRWLVKIYV